MTVHPAVLDAPARFVVLDACVLMSGLLRALMLRLADAGRFHPIWSERIGEEWRRNAHRLWAVPPETLLDEWQAMNTRFPRAHAGDVQPYEVGLRYSDAKDWHVIAAGLASRARCGLARTPQVSVLTWNLKDFNRSELKRQGLALIDPDRLLVQWWQEDPPAMLEALRITVANAPPSDRPPETLPATLHRARLYRLSTLVTRAEAVEAAQAAATATH